MEETSVIWFYGYYSKLGMKANKLFEQCCWNSHALSPQCPKLTSWGWEIIELAWYLKIIQSYHTRPWEILL